MVDKRGRSRAVTDATIPLHRNQLLVVESRLVLKTILLPKIVIQDYFGKGFVAEGATDEGGRLILNDHDISGRIPIIDWNYFWET